MKNNLKNITKKDLAKSIYSKFGTSEKIISSFIDDIFIIFKEILIEEKNRLTVVYNDIMKELVKKSISVEFENCNNILDDDVRRYILEFL